MIGQLLFVQFLIFPHNVSSFPHPFLITAGDKAVLPVSQAPSLAIVWAGIWLSCDYWNLNDSWFLTSLAANPSQQCPQANLSSGHPIFTLRSSEVSFCCSWEIQSYPALTHGLQKVILQPGLPLTFPFPHWHFSLRYRTPASCLGSVGTAWPAPNLLLQLPLPVKAVLPTRVPSFLVNLSNKNLYAFFRRP